jgi:ABC-type multidrug transport system fused ATPase/permease subunit
MYKYLHEILFLLGPDKFRIPKLLLLFLIVSMLDLIGIGLIGPYVAIVVSPELGKEFFEKASYWFDFSIAQNSLLIWMSWTLLVVFFIKSVAAIWINYIIIRFSADQKIRLRSDLMDAYQSLPYATYLTRNSSEYIYNAQTLVDQYGSIIQNLMRILSDSITAIAIIILLATSDPIPLILLVALLVVVMFVYDLGFRKNIKDLGRKTNTFATSMVKGINEGMEGLKEIRILGCENYFLRQVREGSEKSEHYSAHSAMISSVPRYLLEFIMIFFVVILVLLSLIFERSTQELLPTLGMFAIAGLRLLPAANIASSGLIQLRFTRDSVSRLYQDVVNLQSVIGDRGKGKENQELFRQLKIDNISFHYPNAKQDSLHKLSLEIRAGESIGLIGPSGSGKSTLVNVILGLLNPQSGAIKFNKNPLHDSLKTWNNHIAYIPQLIFLIDNTLKKNVALGVAEEDIDEDLLHQALEQARLAELVTQLPMGIETLLGERGVRLSGGQRQRVALARAFYHQRDVLIMDEATSALDNEVEREIISEIKRFKGEKTMIIIAHRLTTVQHCDRIYKIEKGRVIASGSPKEILRTPTYFIDESV